MSDRTLFLSKSYPTRQPYPTRRRSDRVIHHSSTMGDVQAVGDGARWRPCLDCRWPAHIATIRNETRTRAPPPVR